MNKGDVMNADGNPGRVWRSVLALLALGVVLAAACDSGASPTATPTTEPEPTSRLMERLSEMPASFEERGIWFGDMGRALEMAGVSPPGSMEELAALSSTEKDTYRIALSGIVQAGLLARMQQMWEETFGFSSFDVSLAMSTGEASTVPLQVAFLEGDFDEEGIRQHLIDLGYQVQEASGETYYAIRDDYQWGSMMDPAGRLAQSSMNRVFVGDGTLIAAPATEMVTGILAARAGETPSLAEDPAFSSLAQALGDPLSAVLLTREATLSPETGGLADALGAYHRPDDWGTIHPWEALGMGLSRDGDDRWWDIALFYPDPEAAEADADELVRRMEGYTTAATDILGRGAWVEHPMDASCSTLGTRLRNHVGGSTLSIRCALTEDPVAWWLLVDLRDLGFLLP